MLKIKNNNIFISRGETFALDFESWCDNGEPFILPPLPGMGLGTISKHTEVDGVHVYTFYTPLKPYEFNSDSTTLRIDCEKPGGSVTLVILKGDQISVQNIDMPADSVGYVVDKDAVILEIRSTHKIIGLVTKLFNIKEGDYTSILALTVRASTYDSIVCEKYLNLASGNMNFGKTNYIPFGFGKFTSQEIQDTSDMLNDQYWAQDKYAAGELYLMRDSNGYFRELFIEKPGYVGTSLYKFAVSIPFMPQDTINLEPKDYTYDIILYQGKLSNTEEGFPLEKVVWKRELLGPHIFQIGDSHNV